MDMSEFDNFNKDLYWFYNRSVKDKHMGCFIYS